ncbi:hypothetical protein [Streptomyces sp. NPDC086777]|uniref:hypothetical protein n=1 Tax=Streptomyces sp. NPDC086777 TaxID=3154866 RepID=UPI00344C9A50
MASAVLTLLLGGLGAATARAGTDGSLYVDNATADCSDSGPGSQAEPFCQIQPAADAAEPGDTVYIARNSASYAPVTISSAGTADAPITFKPTTGNGAQVTVVGRGTTAVTFSGAQYVDVLGVRPAASGVAPLAINGSAHISYGTTSVTSTATTATVAAITVDGSSSDISLTRLSVAYARGWAFSSAAGAQRVTLADDLFLGEAGGGVSAAGTTGIVLAGDTIQTGCGNAVSLTDGSSGSVENTVAFPGGTTTCADTDGTPAEILTPPSLPP